MDKTLENLKETLEDEIKKIVKKGDITPAELENVQKAVCTIDMIDNMGMGGNSQGYSERRGYYGSSMNNMPYEHMPSNRQYPNRPYGDYSERRYHDSYDDRMYHDGGSYRNYRDDRSYDNYHGDSYRRGRSPVTGRYISRGQYDDGYSGHSIKDRMVARLEDMYDEAKTDHERQIVNEWINRLQGGNQ